MTAQVWDRFMTSLQSVSPSFSRRPSQEALVQAITETLEREGHNFLVAKAGTGTGKSLASVIPALGHLREANESGPVIISTATKNLQAQYFLKDLPSMAEHFPPIGDRPAGFSYTVLKGKSNYICQANLADPNTKSAISPAKLTRLRTYIQTSEDRPKETGEVALLPIQLNGMEARAVTISANDCPGASDCPFGSVCFYEKAKRRAATSDVVVVNHALLMIDAKIRTMTEGRISLLPAPGVLVVDECHKLTSYAQNALSWHLSMDFMFRFANEIFEFDGEEEFKSTVRRLFALITHVPDKERQHIVPRDRFRNSDEVRELINLTDEARKYWTEEVQEAHAEEDRSRMSTCWKKISRCTNLLANLIVLYNPSDNDNFWTEVDSLNRPVLYYKPKEIATFLNESLWQGPDEDGELHPRSSAILMSATPGHFDIGLPPSSGTFNTPSPFNYRTNCRVFIPQDISGQTPPSHEISEWDRVRWATMFKLLEASQGRALLLFTSWLDLSRTYDKLAPQLQKYITVLRQRKDEEAERDQLAKRFKEDETSVLFGTESFFEGVDVPGSSLQLVIISKLPFPSMYDATRGGKLDFMTEMIPEMKLKLEQAAGRLIRSVSDRGLIAVLDNRILTKGYGRQILSSMPPFNKAPRFTQLADAVDYLEGITDDGH